MKFGKLILSLVILGTLLFSNSTALDEAWMMKRFPNWVPPLTDVGNHMYCFDINNQLIATSSHFIKKINKQNKLSKIIKMFNWGHEEIYNAFPSDSLPQYIQEQIGDTLLIADGNKYYKVILENAGYFMGACDLFPAFGLKQIDSLPKKLKYDDFFLGMPKDSHKFETIKPIIRIERYDDELDMYIDSIKNVVKNKLLNIQHNYIKSSYLDSIDVQYYDIEDDTTQNSFFIRIDGYNLSSIANYHAIIYSHIYEGKREYIFLAESFNEKFRFNIVYAIYINSDKYIDYFIEGDLGATVLTIRRNVADNISSFHWDGC